MTRLSSNATALTATVMWGLIGCAVVVVTRGRVGVFGVVALAGFVYSVWFGRRLSDVWLDGDELEVKGRTSFRVPLADVLVLGDTGGGRTARVVVLGFDHPVGGITQVRFMPEGGGANTVILKDLQARIHAARGSRSGALK